MLIRCPGCDQIHDSSLVICPDMGRCLACGRKRLTSSELEQLTRCCFVPHCHCCGRCHGCGVLQFTDMMPCECGFPSDPKQRAVVERFKIG